MTTKKKKTSKKVSNKTAFKVEVAKEVPSVPVSFLLSIVSPEVILDELIELQKSNIQFFVDDIAYWKKQGKTFSGAKKLLTSAEKKLKNIKKAISALQLAKKDLQKLGGVI